MLVPHYSTVNTVIVIIIIIIIITIHQFQQNLNYIYTTLTMSTLVLLTNDSVIAAKLKDVTT